MIPSVSLGGGNDKIRNSEIQKSSSKSTAKKIMSNEEAIFNACQDMTMISKALQQNTGQMTED